MLAYGRQPYSGIELKNVMPRVIEGHRLDQPKGCPDDVWDVVYSCWVREPNRRPTFRQLRKAFEYLMKQHAVNTASLRDVGMLMNAELTENIKALTLKRKGTGTVQPSAGKGGRAEETAIVGNVLTCDVPLQLAQRSWELSKNNVTCGMLTYPQKCGMLVSLPLFYEQLERVDSGVLLFVRLCNSLGYPRLYFVSILFKLSTCLARVRCRPVHPVRTWPAQTVKLNARPSQKATTPD